MPENDLQKDFGEVWAFREGATYRRMDLHTHSPASECSSYKLPPQLAAAFPPKPEHNAEKQARYDFVAGLARGETAALARAWAATEAGLLPRVGGCRAFAPETLSLVAREWTEAIDRAVGEVGEDGLSPEQARVREDMVAVALRDLCNYLLSLLFPHDYVLRCYLEQLEIVALTDHNHPGYIVPRVPCLGTWYDAICEVNDTFVRDIRDAEGAAVRTVILRHLQEAGPIVDRTVNDVEAKPLLKQQHEEARQKQLASLAARKAHIAERAAHWSAGQLRLLTLIRGTELTVSNVHLLALFPPEWFVPLRIGGILGDMGIPEEQWGCGFLAAASASVQDALTAVAAAGGIAIPAHANSSSKGLLRLFERGLALTKVLEHPQLLALETTGEEVIRGKGKNDPGKNACETLQWLESGQGRPERSKRLGFTKGSDAHECRIGCDGCGEDLGQRYTNVKLEIRPKDTPAEVFRSLRLALMSGGDRLIEYPTEDGLNYRADRAAAVVPKAEREKLLAPDLHRVTILGLTVYGDGSYADRLQVRFNPFLNCVVGSGGASTTVRTLSYAFGALKFMEGSATSWLPECVRVFWLEGGVVNCVERRGRHVDPAECDTTWSRRDSAGCWQRVDDDLATLPERVQIWPSAEVQDHKKTLSHYESSVIKQLVSHLVGVAAEQSRPLLVNQPHELFNGGKLFNEVLGAPALKCRQMIWSTGSANVPAALDAEKIIVTREVKRGHQMELLCAGDLHEDEIRDVYLNHFEGGWAGFRRRMALYEA